MNNFITELIIIAPPLLLALTLHEFAHGYVAYRLGDPTARMAGRLTLNPLKHLDPLGTIAFFLIKIGWARPVPVNAAYFRNPRQDMLWVALAGPATNLIVAVVSAIATKAVWLLMEVLPSTPLVTAVLIPFQAMLIASVWINLVLCIFNFLPIPPLDGSRILSGILPQNLAAAYSRLEHFGFILILVLAFSGILSKIITPIIDFAHSLLLS
ncbi:site-2 protease family protein [Desulfoprunum benzoelyticum]|uniref:Zn-dependent protease n=1 Tax=Desulfoprunum benzoelyticum TaxID=1506996 RepID=A0A840UZY9_9BACT|nr:site-2 protease family protein [Desulfoprunum benzoelyticum]MBB5347120.1 Zn-dependent protease [Desulfoprunum benzoelyticum]MBM9531245.1 site-2 protease family protein [Desulfoprunum benzoelyticum]